MKIYKIMKYKYFHVAYLFFTTILLIFLSSEIPVGNMNNKSDSINKCGLKVIAHRGAWKKNGHPQNSIASLRNAIELKVDGSEFDVRITSDDSLVINHDREYNKMVIEKTPYTTLVKYRLSNGEKLPTLREYIAEGLKNNSTTKLICELKSAEAGRERNIYMAEKSIMLAKELNALNYITWISFDYDIVKRISELLPGAEVFYLNGDISPIELKKASIKGAGYNYSVFRKRPEWIEEAKKEGILLNVWTVNNEDDMDFFISKCFDYITSDEPEILMQKIKEYRQSK